MNIPNFFLSVALCLMINMSCSAQDIVGKWVNGEESYEFVADGYFHYYHSETGHIYGNYLVEDATLFLGAFPLVTT